MTFEQAVSEIAEVSGHAVIFTQVSLSDYAEALRRDGLPEGEIALITYLFTEVLDGRNSHLSDGVERALRRPPRDFTEFARRTASSGVWSARNTT
jgi:hypothetical protein